MPWQQLLQAPQHCPRQAYNGVYGNPTDGNVDQAATRVSNQHQPARPSPSPVKTLDFPPAIA